MTEATVLLMLFMIVSGFEAMVVYRLEYYKRRIDHLRKKGGDKKDV